MGVVKFSTASIGTEKLDNPAWFASFVALFIHDYTQPTHTQMITIFVYAEFGSSAYDELVSLVSKFDFDITVNIAAKPMFDNAKPHLMAIYQTNIKILYSSESETEKALAYNICEHLVTSSFATFVEDQLTIKVPNPDPQSVPPFKIVKLKQDRIVLKHTHLAHITHTHSARTDARIEHVKG
ncbi:MAG: hypothetical protein EBX50_20455 [Chitinophagia bacterium]|nr:hypothetical protein [Chitinophagia bacterium]